MTVLTKAFAAAAALLLVGLLSGCATGRPVPQALVCPQCQTVTIEPMPRLLSPDELEFAPHNMWSDTVFEHQCPGCQGALATLFKEGRLKHVCSICEQGGFRCPVSHK